MNFTNIKNPSPRAWSLKLGFGLAGPKRLMQVSKPQIKNLSSNIHKRGLKYHNKPLPRDVWSVEPNKIMTVPEVQKQKPSHNFPRQSSF